MPITINAENIHDAAEKLGRLKPRGGRQNGERNNYQDFCSLALGMRYPLPEFGEQIMGYPLGWTFAEISSKQKACDDKKRKRPYFHTGNH